MRLSLCWCTEILQIFSPHLIIADIFRLAVSYHWDSPWNAVRWRSVHFPGRKIAGRSRFWAAHSFEFWRHFCFFSFSFRRTSRDFSRSSRYESPLIACDSDENYTFVSQSKLALVYLLFFFHGRKASPNLNFHFTYPPNSIENLFEPFSDSRVICFIDKDFIANA